MKEFCDFNWRFQDVLFLWFGSGFVIDLEKVKLECFEFELELWSIFSEEVNMLFYYFVFVFVMDKYILDNGKVYLGSGIWVDEEKWYQL